MSTWTVDPVKGPTGSLLRVLEVFELPERERAQGAHEARIVDGAPHDQACPLSQINIVDDQLPYV